MPDTVRTQSDLLTNLFQDGQDRGITAQDMRDFIVSITPPFGGLYFSTAAVTTISVAGTYVKAAGTTTATNLSSDITMPANNRLQYNGVAQKHFHIVAQASVDLASGTNQDIGLQVWRYDNSAASGALLAHSEARTTVAGTDVIQITTHADAVLDTSDYIELHIANNTGTPNITVEFGYLFLVGMLM